MAIQLHSQYLVLKLSLEVVAYTNRSEINKKIGSSCIIQKKSKTIKKFLRMYIIYRRTVKYTKLFQLL